MSIGQVLNATNSFPDTLALKLAFFQLVHKKLQLNIQRLFIFVSFSISEVTSVLKRYVYINVRFKFKGLTSLHTLVHHVHIFLIGKSGVQAQQATSR